ncbi:MAG: hypothetical protein KF788_08870 [Piscinibacter sp.]|nr:hypothetical protein [Piscinibacter sp.]
MSRFYVNGTIPKIAATFRGTQAAITDISNAANAVATLAAAHSYQVGDYVEILTSGWNLLAGRVFRISALSTNDATLEGCDTQDTSKYPASQGAGTSRAVLTWANLQQINELEVSGGEQEFSEGQYIDNPLKFRFPTSQTPIDVRFLVDDDQAAAYWAHVKASRAALANRPLRFDFPEGGKAAGTGIWTYSAAPAMELNNTRRRTINVAMAAEFTEYTS